MEQQKWSEYEQEEGEYGRDWTEDVKALVETKESPQEKKQRQREQQITLGKATPEYARYLQLVPLENRSPRLRFSLHPVTPPASGLSKRAFTGQVQAWRRLLHQYDVPEAEMPDLERIAQEQGVEAAEQMIFRIQAQQEAARRKQELVLERQLKRKERRAARQRLQQQSRI
jgi:hypothetical protein